MKKIIALLLVSIKICAQPNLTLAKKDGGVLHVYSGMAISAGVGAKIYSITKRPMLAATIGFLSGSLIGVGKEAIYDKLLKKGVSDKSDAFKTIWGSAIGGLCLRIGIDVKQKNDIEKQNYQDLNNVTPESVLKNGNSFQNME
ncbi:MAG: hypothetical protein Q8L81_09610 [Bacteroidota bacterium]|nr:hypothetical protein [Bacteroidota bacterium]